MSATGWVEFLALTQMAEPNPPRLCQVQGSPDQSRLSLPLLGLAQRLRRDVVTCLDRSGFVRPGPKPSAAESSLRLRWHGWRC